MVNCTKEVITERNKEYIWDKNTEIVGGNENIFLHDEHGEGAQKLTQEEILQIRENCDDVDQVVSKIMENNKNFEMRTEFSKQKIIKKMKDKYSFWVKAEVCSMENL